MTKRMTEEEIGVEAREISSNEGITIAAAVERLRLAEKPPFEPPKLQPPFEPPKPEPPKQLDSKPTKPIPKRKP